MMSLLGSSGVAMLQRNQQTGEMERGTIDNARRGCDPTRCELSSRCSQTHLVTHPVWPSRVPCGR
jgi:hypothetical protein